MDAPIVAPARVISLVPNRNLAHNPSDLADCLEAFALRVRRGEYENLERVLLVLDADYVDCFTAGKPARIVEMVGLLEYAKSNLMFPDVEREAPNA